MPAIEWKSILFNWNDCETLINRALELAKRPERHLLALLPKAFVLNDG